MMLLPFIFTNFATKFNFKYFCRVKRRKTKSIADIAAQQERIRLNMIRNMGYNVSNVSRNDIARYNRVRSITNRYIANAQRSIGLSNQNTARIKSRARSTENRYFESGYPDNDRRLALDMSQHGDRQVSRRVYMGLSNG